MEDEWESLLVLLYRAFHYYQISEIEKHIFLRGYVLTQKDRRYLKEHTPNRLAKFEIIDRFRNRENYGSISDPAIRDALYICESIHLGRMVYWRYEGKSKWRQLGNLALRERYAPYWDGIEALLKHEHRMEDILAIDRKGTFANLLRDRQETQARTTPLEFIKAFRDLYPDVEVSWRHAEEPFPPDYDQIDYDQAENWDEDWEY